MVLPPGSNAKHSPQVSSQLPSAIASIGSRLHPANAPVGARVRVSERPSDSGQGTLGDRRGDHRSGGSGRRRRSSGFVRRLLAVTRRRPRRRETEVAKTDNVRSNTARAPSAPKSASRSPGEHGREQIDRRRARPTLRLSRPQVDAPVSPRPTPPERPGDFDCWCRPIFIRWVTAGKSGRD